MTYVSDIENYKDSMAAVQDDERVSRDRGDCSHPDREKDGNWTGNINGWILNQVMAPNPFVRYLTSMMYLSDVNGLSKINYPDSEFMKAHKFREAEISTESRTIFHNAWNL